MQDMEMRKDWARVWKMMTEKGLFMTGMKMTSIFGIWSHVIFLLDTISRVHFLYVVFYSDFFLHLLYSLTEINSQIASAKKIGAIFKNHFLIELVLTGVSFFKAPYLICVELCQGYHFPKQIHSKGSSDGHKLSKGGIPLANGDSTSQTKVKFVNILYIPFETPSNITLLRAMHRKTLPTISGWIHLDAVQQDDGDGDGDDSEQRYAHIGDAHNALS
ncbi:hypothetical protein ACJX0J_014769, partial [Zea mays]